MISTGTARKNSTKTDVAQRSGPMSDMRIMASTMPRTIDSTMAVAAARRVVHSPGKM